MIKAKNWSGKDLKGVWHVTIKIDGVRALWNDGSGKGQCEGDVGWYSRNGKPLYNLPRMPKGIKDVEVYCGGFKETIERVRAKTRYRPIAISELYSLDPLDKRLEGMMLTDPRANLIKEMMKGAIASGYEGLVLRQGDTWLKVKPTETYDVPVIDMLHGTGKHHGRMGALITPMGKVGTGFTDAEREDWWSNKFERTKGDTIIEVECMKLTDDGKFRHPRFVRLRPDK